MHTRMHTHRHTNTLVYTNFLDKSNGKKNQVSTGPSEPAYTKRVNKIIKSFKRSTTHYTKADNILYSTKSFFKKELKSKQKHPRYKRTGQELKGSC